MPKLKTNRAAAKRFKRTSGGSIKRNKAFGRHLKTCKSSKRRRDLRTATILHPAEQKRVERMLPYK